MRNDPTSIDQLLNERFRGTALPAGHRGVVEKLLARRSMLLVAPHHRRDSLTWQLAAVLGCGPVLVITPSARGLARRADEIANRAGLVTCRLDAEIAGTGLTTLRDQLRAGRWDAALVSARHLGDPRVMEAARSLRPKLVVVEDAHCLSRHGHRFDPCYRHAAALAENADCALALSDVADRAARNEIADALDISEDPVIDLGLADLQLEIRNTPERSKRDAHLLSLMKTGPDRAVVLVGMRVEAERITRMIEDQCRLPAVNLAGRRSDDFAAALRGFREGSVRVLVATGALAAGERWPPVPLVVVHALPESPEMLHRQARLATGDGARAVLLYDRTEYDALERACLRCAPEIGHLLAIHAAIRDEERVDYASLSTGTGLHPEEVHLGVEMLVSAAAMAVRRRGDDWVEADAPDPLEGEILIDCARDALMLRRARLKKAERLLAFARARSCRRIALGRALDYEVSERRCRCDRCAPPRPEPKPEPVPQGYPIETDDARGWAAGLYHPPGREQPDDEAGGLLQRLKYDGDEEALEPLARLMAEQVEQRPPLRDCDLVVPIPPTDPDAAASTSTLLAEQVGVSLAIPIARALTSTGDRLAQKDLSSLRAKRQNIADGFTVTDGDTVAGRIVLLVDDVFDSGATMQEAVRLLRRAGARDVRLLAAARTIFGWRRDF